VTYALFAGDIRDAFRRAAEVSRQVHIRYTGRKYKRVVALLDPHYDELWVGGKASYKLGAIIEEGGELIIYAPHLTKLSETHGALIEKYGYAPLESVRDMLGVSQELRENLCIAAHLAHVAYAGRLDQDGKVVPRYKITMASGLDEETCRRVNLGYRDYRTFDYEVMRSDADTLIVANAGRDLYQVSYDISHAAAQRKSPNVAPLRRCVKIIYATRAASGMYSEMNLFNCPPPNGVENR
jgi:hypothetical protein